MATEGSVRLPLLARRSHTVVVVERSRRSADHPAQRADDVGVFGAVAGGDADELAGFEAFLVVAGSRVDPAADQQAADELVGIQAAAELDQGEVGEWVG